MRTFLGTLMSLRLEFSIQLTCGARTRAEPHGNAQLNWRKKLEHIIWICRSMRSLLQCSASLRWLRVRDRVFESKAGAR